MTVITKEWREYVASDGTLSMNANGRREPYDKKHIDSCDNDNSVWVLSCILLSNDIFNLGNLDFFIHHLDSTRVDGYAGIYHRNPGRKHDITSHDNFISHVSLFSHYKLKHKAEEMLMHYPSWNNVAPGVINWVDAFSGKPSGWIQPKDWCCLKLVCDVEPSWLETVWLTANFLLALAQKKGKHDSECINNWMRANIVFNELNRSHLNAKEIVIYIGASIFKLIVSIRKWEPLNEYYKQGHPAKKGLRWVDA